jgi:CSLREA domain-containing protein
MIVEQRSLGKWGYVPLFAAICLFVLSTSAAFADDFTVTKTADTNDGTCDSDCSLREAIVAANAHSGPDRIILGSAQTYTLTLGPADAPGALTAASGDLDVTDELTIDGNGSTVDGSGLAPANLDRVFDIQGSFPVTINNLTITGGSATGFLSLGGGLYIRNATVTLNNCTVTANNTAVETGSRDDGGGIAAIGSYDPAGPTTTLAVLTLNNTTVSGNSGLNGGGILCVLCTLTVASSTISGNTATGSDGGGIDLLGDASKVTATGSALKSNQVTGTGAQGGGLSMPFGSGILSSLTRNQIVSNTATTGSGIFVGVATVAATDNWWGCNFGPGVGDSNVTCAGTPNGVSGVVTTSPFLVLKTSASPTSIATGGTSTVTADLTFNSSNADTSAGGTVPNGIVAAFSGTLGTFATPTATTVAGKATDVYTAGGTSGVAGLSAVVDGQTASTSLTVLNVPPTLDAIPDPPAILEDAALQTVNLAGIGAGGGESQTLTVTALSNNTGLIPNPTVSYTSPNGTGSLSYTPVADASGSAIITVTVDDGGSGTHTVSRTFTVVVNAVNDPPTLDAIPNPSAILEDAALQTVNLSGITAGGGETGQTLTVTALSNNTGLIPNPTVSYTSPNATGSLSYTPVANASGSAIITVTVDDGGSGTHTFSRTFTVNVTAVNDPPTLNLIADPPVILEDAGLQTVSLSGISAGGGESQTLTVTALSNNTGLIPNPTVTYTSPNATGSLSYTPVANANGSAIITVTVDDGGTGTHTVTRIFTVNVTAVNDLPTIAAIPDQFVPMNGSPGIPITIGDVETAASALVVTATSSNQTVVPNSGLVVGAGGTSRTLTVTPAANQGGTATITVTVSDGTGLTSTSFVATVATGLSIADATMAEGNSGATNLSVTVSLTGPAPSTVSAHFATRQRTAIEGVDYVGVAGTVSFAPGATTATILVPVIGDTTPEIDETFFIELSAAVGGVITRAQAVGTIANDDPTTPVTAEVATWGRRSGVTTNGGTLTKTAGAGWTAAASPTKAVKAGDGSVEFSATAPDQTWVVGLSRSVSPFLVVTDIEFGLELFADGTFAVVEHGVNLTGPLGGYAAGDRFAIAVTGGVLRYQRNGVTIYTSAGTPLYPLRIDAALFTPGATIADVVLAGRLVPLGGTAGDVDNDGKSDFTVFRASPGGWHTLKSSTNYTTSQSVSWGLSTDVPVPGDYDGDGQMDPAIYRPSTGQWAYLKSSTNYTTSVTVSWGLSTDLPVPADYDGDGKTDPAVYRPSTGGWYVLKSSTNYTSSIGVLWGLSTDLPVPADYDGDGQADPAIYRPSTGLWAFLKSTTSYTTSVTVSWGLSTDVAVPGDYDGDGKADPAVFRSSTGGWHILKSSTNFTSSVSLSWGLSTDVPVPADYDGDGRFDPAIFRPSAGLWAVLKSSTNYTSSVTASWGLSTDTPINKRP